MKSETLMNLVQGVISFAFGIIALIGAIFFYAWWHFFSAFFVCCFLMYSIQMICMEQRVLDLISNE